jgi:hypothetical protein
VDERRVIGKMGADEEEMHKGYLTPPIKQKKKIK